MSSIFSGIEMNLSSFNELARKLKADVYDLCLPEGRMVRTEGHKVAEEFLMRRLEEVGCVPYAGGTIEMPYVAEAFISPNELGDHEFLNLIGVVPGTNRDLPPVLVGAHYDSVIGAPCADDNGAAVAICLAIAEGASLAGGLERDLVVAIFDAEEPPYFLSPSMGSNRFYADQLDKRGVHFALIFDLVGHDVSIPEDYLPLLEDLLGPMGKEVPMELVKNFLFMTGAESHSDLARLVCESNTSDDLRLVATLNEHIGDMSDHGVFRRNDVPCLFFSCGRWEHYHRITDTPEKLNYQKMAHIAQLSADILDRVASDPLLGSPEGDHTLDFEIQTLKEGLGIAMPFVLQHLGLSKLETRSELTTIVHAISSLGI
jgi:hypothetical protein